MHAIGANLFATARCVRSTIFNGNIHFAIHSGKTRRAKVQWTRDGGKYHRANYRSECSIQTLNRLLIHARMNVSADQSESRDGEADNLLFAISSGNIHSKIQNSALDARLVKGHSNSRVNRPSLALSKRLIWLREIYAEKNDKRRSLISRTCDRPSKPTGETKRRIRKQIEDVSFSARARDGRPPSGRGRRKRSH